MTSARYRSDPGYRAYIQALVAQAPPVSPERRDRIALHLNSVRLPHREQDDQ